jgi:hypothetical protein
MTAQLAVVQKALPEEKASRSVADRSLTEEKAAHQIAEQSLRTSDEARADLAWDLEAVQASLTATTNKLANKSSALDFTVVRDQKMEIHLKVVEEKLKAANEKLKTQG